MEEIVDPTTGEILKGTPIFESKDRLRLILWQSSHVAVGKFESSSMRARTFVRDNQIWRILFRRDYKSIYKNAIDPGRITMKKEIKKKIDSFTATANVGTDETYWKRYYEFIYKTEEYFKKSRTFSLYPNDDWISFATSTIDYAKTRRQLYPEEQVEYEDIPDDSLWLLKRKPNTDVFYYYDEGGKRAMQIDINVPDNRIIVNVDKTLFDTYQKYEVSFEYKATQAASGRSVDGFRWFTTYGSQLRILTPTALLVSCVVCTEAVGQLYHCACCGDIFCGKECQKIHHK